ncbi:MAG: TIR domain-containing protein [Cyclobacteriaceae bacterium]
MPNKIFLSWSKQRSKRLAKEVKLLFENLFGSNVKMFISAGMEKGSLVDAGIHDALLESKICLVCITSESLKSPWLMYEAGTVFGSGGIVIPILFEEIPDWHSWIDKPLVRYVPVRYDGSNEDFLKLVNKVEEEFKVKALNFERNWDSFSEKVNQILLQHQSIPIECKHLVEKLKNQNDNYFTPDSPEIKEGQIVFHRGFHSDPLYKILTDNIKDEGGKYFWYYGRKGSKILKRQYLSFFEYLAEVEKLGGMGVDFRCLLVKPNSIGSKKADRGQAEKFKLGLQESIEYALNLKNLGLTPSKYFRLYENVRDSLIVRCDNSVLSSGPVYDTNGVLNYFTERPFHIFSTIKGETDKESKGYLLTMEFEKVWKNSAPLTEDLFNNLYKKKVFYQ